MVFHLGSGKYVTLSLVHDETNETLISTAVVLLFTRCMLPMSGIGNGIGRLSEGQSGLWLRVQQKVPVPWHPMP